MASVGEITVRLSREMSELVEKKVRSGAYGSASDVVQASLRALDDRDADIEQWLRDEVVPGHVAYLHDPSSAVPTEDILDRIKARRTTVAK